jgi:16S rRNA (uracil1498-N3)-methyltransferase
MIRLYVPDPLGAGADIAVSPEQARYLVAVMRRAVGDEVTLFNGRDGEWRAVLAEVSKRGCRLRVEARTREQSSGPDLDLIVALVKRTRLETIVEKATELGARRIRLVVTDFTNSDHANVARLRAIAIEAAEQTGRLDAPDVLAAEKLVRLLDAWEPGRRLMFCDEAGDAFPALAALAGPAPAGTPGWAILIGPEGGFSPDERRRLRALAFVTPVTLGPRILRADTAAISALTLWQAALGDWASRKPAP